MSNVIPKPQKPWQPTTADKMKNLLIVFAAFALAGASVKLTGLNGKLGFFFSLFFALLILNFGFHYFKRGTAAAKDALLQVFAVMAIVITLIPIVSIVSTVFIKGYKGLHWGILTNDMALASVNDPIATGGLLHALAGTVIMVGGALIISFPIGVLTALYLTEIRGSLTRPIKFLVQAMSGVPSIVAGLFILSALIYPVTGERTGLMGALALAILMIPTVARTAEEVLLLIPNDLREAGLALGATQWRTVAMVVVPAVKSGLVTAIILGIARVIGETAPILLVSGGGEATNFNPVSGPMGSIPYYVWKSFQLGGTEESSQRTWAGLLVLILWVLFLFSIARYISSRSQKR
jgi:phosphate transport system permease protein